MAKVPRINIVQAKSVLTKSGLPASDYVVNPYNGCLFGCMYCYAAQIARWKHAQEKWGGFLDVKINAPEILKLELNKLERKHGSRNFGSIFFSSVTDPYVGMEAKYNLTRKCLEVLADFKYRGKISIQTKSPLVIKDIGVIKKLKNVSVGFTVTSLDDRISGFLEVKAPPVSKRIQALKMLYKEGIATYAFIGPILPHFINSKDKINGLLDKLEEAGVKEVWFEHINLSKNIKDRLYGYLQENAPGLIPVFENADTEDYRNKMDSVIAACMQGRKLSMGYPTVIYHNKLPKKLPVYIK